MMVLEIQYKNLSVFAMYKMKTNIIIILICLCNASIVAATDELMWYDTDGEMVQSKKLAYTGYWEMKSIGDYLFLWDGMLSKMNSNGIILWSVGEDEKERQVNLCESKENNTNYLQGVHQNWRMYTAYIENDSTKKWENQYPKEVLSLRTFVSNNKLGSIEVRAKEENIFHVNVINANGDVIWNTTHAVENDIADMILRFDREDSVVIGTSNLSRKIDLFQFDSKGQLVARDILEYGFLASLETTENSIILLLGRNDSNIYDLLYYNKNLEQLLSIELGIYADYETQLVVDSQDNVFVAGCERSSGFCQEVKLTKINSDGDILWTQKFQAESLGLKKMELDKEENPVIGMDRCDFYDEYGIGCRMLLLKYDSDGNLMWKAESESKDEVEQVFEDLTIDQDNNVIAMIYSDEADDDSNNDDDDDEKGCGC